MKKFNRGKNKKKDKKEEIKIGKSVTKENTKRIKLCRTVIVWALFFLIGKLAWITLVRGNEYRMKGEEQWTKEVEIKAKRGKILDRNGSELAVSGDVYRVDVDLKTLKSTMEKRIEQAIKSKSGKIDKKAIKEEETDKLVKELGTVLNKKPEDILKIINKKNIVGVELARQIDKATADKIKELNINGVIISDDTKRYYPNDSLLAHTLGTLDSNGKGLIGLELKYNNVLAGVSGVKIGESNPFGKEDYTEPVQGKDLVLTIDEKIQYLAEREAKQALKDENAQSVNILVMDPNNGEVLAMASEKSFNPNEPRKGFESFSGKNESEKIQQMWRNKIVSNMYEPGSTFKVITAAAAIEEGVAGNGESYYCPGYKEVAGRRINCWKREGHGAQTFMQALNNSCNPAFIDIGMKLGKEKLQKYVKAFGFGQSTGIDLPGESKGIIKELEEMSIVDLATISFGQTNAVTMVQLLSAFNATVNGGTLVEPHVMKEITHLDDSGVRVIDEKNEPKKSRVISEETSKKIRAMLQDVVDNGTGKRAFIEGYNVGGKTGTAQTVDSNTGAYGKEKIASFIAEAPSDNPKVTILVTIDGPNATADSGGIVAAPVAKRVLEGIFNYQSPEKINFETKSTNSTIVPEVRGKEVKTAEAILKENNLEFQKVGEGKFVKSISPIPGSVIGTGEKVKIEVSEKPAHEKEVVVPDFIGFSKEMTEKMLNKIGLTGSFKGEGDLIKEQKERPGTKVSSASKITFTLKK